MSKLLISESEKMNILEKYRKLDENVLGVARNIWKRTAKSILNSPTIKKLGYDSIDDLIDAINLGKLSASQTGEIVLSMFKNANKSDKVSIAKALVKNPQFLSKYFKISEKSTRNAFKKSGKYTDDEIDIFINQWKKSGNSFGKNIVSRSWKRFKRIWAGARRGANKTHGIVSLVLGFDKNKRLRRIFNWFFFGTTRTRAELIEMISKSTLRDVVPTLALSLGIEVFKRWLYLSVALTFFKTAVEWATDINEEGKEREESHVILGFLKRMWENSVAAKFSWVFPAWFTWKYVNRYFGDLLLAIVNGDKQEIGEEWEKTKQKALDDINDKISESEDALRAYAGSSLSKHIYKNDDGFYLGTPDYPITYYDNLRKWVVEFPNGEMYDIKDIQE